MRFFKFERQDSKNFNLFPRICPFEEVHEIQSLGQSITKLNLRYLVLICKLRSINKHNIYIFVFYVLLIKIIEIRADTPYTTKRKFLSKIGVLLWKMPTLVFFKVPINL